MKPLCPSCLNEMSKTTQSKMFNCQPCREFIQFFGANVGVKRQIQPSSLATRRPVRIVRAA